MHFTRGASAIERVRRRLILGSLSAPAALLAGLSLAAPAAGAALTRAGTASGWSVQRHRRALATVNCRTAAAPSRYFTGHNGKFKGESDELRLRAIADALDVDVNYDFGADDYVMPTEAEWEQWEQSRRAAG